MHQINFTDIEDIEVGHAQDLKAGTGCTVVMCKKGVVAGIDVRGGAPGTRETDLLDPVNLVKKIHAVVLAGGSAFGLDAAAGVMERAVISAIMKTKSLLGLKCTADLRPTYR